MSYPGRPRLRLFALIELIGTIGICIVGQGSANASPGKAIKSDAPTMVTPAQTTYDLLEKFVVDPHPAEYGGVYIEPKTNSVALQVVNRNIHPRGRFTSTQLRALLGAHTSGARVTVETKNVSNSQQELQRAVLKIRVLEKSDPGFVAANENTLDNVVDVVVRNPKSVAARKISTEFGDKVHLARGAPIDLTRKSGYKPDVVCEIDGPFGTRLDDCENYFQPGGIRINVGGASAAPCTAGFTVKNAAGHYGTTAGHCKLITSSENVYHARRYLGDIWGVYNDEDSDSALIEIPDDEWDPSVYRGDLDSHDVFAVRGKAIEKAGDDVCADGSVSGEVCNVRVSDTKPDCWDFVINSVKVTKCGLVLGQKDGSAVVQPGDSGGPVFTSNSDKTVNAVGIIIGSPTQMSYSEVLYEPINYVLDDEGMTLYTCHDETPSC